MTVQRAQHRQTTRCLAATAQAATAGLAIACGAATSARAQLLDPFISSNVFGTGAEPGVTVLSRSRPEFDNGGVRVGSFIIRPQAAQSVGYESNVLARKNAVGSSLAETTASVSAGSNWSRNSLGGAIGVDNFRYFERPDQSYTNWNANIGGSLDVGRDVLTVQYQHMQLNQTNRDLDTPGLDRPLPYNVDSATATYRVNLNRVSIIPGITVSKYAYTNGSVVGFSYDQTYRDRVVVIPSLAVSYEFSPRRSAVLVVRNGTGSYSNQAPGIPQRDYNNPAVLGGVDYDVTGLFRIRMLVGYEERLFNNAAYKTISAPIIEATAIWTPTGLTTVTGIVSRHIQDTADEATAAYTQTALQLSVDHEYLRNILLRGTGGVTLGDYTGGSQTLYAAGAGLTYLTNRYARVSANYDFQSRTSSGSVPLGTIGQTFGGNYTDHRVLLQLRLAL